MGFVLKGAALFRASTLLAAVGFLLFGYDQVNIKSSEYFHLLILFRVSCLVL